MDEQARKMAGKVILLIAAVAAAVLLYQWVDLLQAAASGNTGLELVSGERLDMMSYMKNASLTLAILLPVMAAGIVLCFFTRDRLLRIAVLALQAGVIVTIACLCGIASRYMYADEKLVAEFFAAITAFQAGLMQLSVSCAILLGALCYWFIPQLISDAKAARANAAADAQTAVQA